MRSATTRRARPVSPRTALLLCTALCLLAGCKVRMEAESRVAEDGSLERSVRYLVSDNRRAWFEERLLLPTGSVHSEQTRSERDAESGREYTRTTHVYTSSSTAAPGAVIEPDFRMRASGQEAMAHNGITITVRDYLLLRTYEYRERYEDISSVAAFRSAAEQVYDAFADALVARIVERAGGRFDAAESRARFADSFDADFERFIARILELGWGYLQGDQFEREFPDLQSEENVWARLDALFPPAPDGDAAAWREQVRSALDDSLPKDLTERPWVAGALFGARGQADAGEQEFAVSLQLPGRPTDYNATRRDGELLRWEFTQDDFFARPYELAARSRLLLWDRIAGAALLGLLLAAFLLRRAWLRRR